MNGCRFMKSDRRVFGALTGKARESIKCNKIWEQYNFFQLFCGRKCFKLLILRASASHLLIDAVKILFV